MPYSAFLFCNFLLPSTFDFKTLLLISSYMSKFLSVESFRWNVTIMISNFVLIFKQLNRIKNCWPEMVLYGTFSVPCCCTVLLNQHMYFRHRKKSAFFAICFSEVEISKDLSTFYTFYIVSERWNISFFEVYLSHK